MSRTFQLIKDAVDIVDVAKHFGLSVDTHKKAHCPLHKDKTPSLSFRDQRFKCFSCGAGGDAIDLVQLLTDANTALEAARYLNQSCRLGFDLDGPVPVQQIQEWQKRREQRRMFEEWKQNAFTVLNAYSWFLRDCRKYYAPRCPDEPLHPLFVESLTKLDYVDYVIDAVFIEGDDNAVKDLYIKSYQWVSAVGQRLLKEKMSYAGHTGSDHRARGPFVPRVIQGGKILRPVA